MKIVNSIQRRQFRLTRDGKRRKFQDMMQNYVFSREAILWLVLHSGIIY